MPSISSSIEATLAQLDALHQQTLERHRNDAAALAGMVGRLGDPFGADDEVVVTREGREPDPRIGRPTGAAPDPERFVPLPRTTTKPWGASMRAKFIAEARDRGDW